jgi:SagB-type dehydrogenase family enzyme
MFAYHEATKHSVAKLRASHHTLDWANLPDPFREYEGVPVIDLPADPEPPAIPALEVLRDAKGATALTGVDFLSQLLFYSASISATKELESAGYRYALRVNPSSGNLHPTEFHFATRGGLFHYRASSHMIEQRGTGDFVAALGLDAPLVFILTSIAWREAWKYEERAYRYCLHDVGHAAESLMLGARALGCEPIVIRNFVDNAVAVLIGVEDEWPMLLIEIEGCTVDLGKPGSPTLTGGTPNQLSQEIIPYPLITAIHTASKLDALAAPEEIAPSAHESAGGIPLTPVVRSSAPFSTVVRRRRSAQNFLGGSQLITFEQFSTLLDVALNATEYIELFIYVHRVFGLEPGLYRLKRGSLDLIKEGDQRVIAAGLSLGQDLAGDSCVTISMVGDLDRASRAFGNRGYRYVHFEAGIIGQRLYIAAESMGFRSTGIGAFYDDQVNKYLGLDPCEGQVVYHFACGFGTK